MKTEGPYRIVSYILAKLTATSSPADEAQLEKWLQESETHREIFNQLLQKENFEQYQSMFEEHPDEYHYLQMQKHIKKEKRICLFKRVGYAAAILILFVFSALLWPQSTQEEPSHISDTSTSIRPGSPFAILTLPGGTTIQLDSTTRRSPILQTGIISQQDTLVYQRSNNVKGEYHTLFIPRGGEYILKLSDGTKIWLNAESELKYPVQFEATQRKVYLKGEAYFEVAKNEHSPFIVITGEQTTTVLGTSFNLRAYPEEAQILTTLEKGSVQISTSQGNTILKPGEQARTLSNSQTIEKTQVNTSLYTAWHLGKYIFIDQPLEEILHTLARWYNMNIWYDHPDLKKIQFTGELRKYDDIQEFLEKIEHLEKVHFQIQDQTVSVFRY